MRRVSFLNCHNLYFPGTHKKRGPRSLGSYELKLKHLARTIRNACNGQLPDIVGLCEVGDARVAQELGLQIDPVGKGYQCVWSGIPRAINKAEPQTGLAVLYKFGTLGRSTRKEKTDVAKLGSRHNWMACEFQIGVKASDLVWIVVNHWTSDYRRASGHAEMRRTTSAREIGEYFTSLNVPSAESAILIGDFNCEPFSKPFSGNPRTDRLYGVRERALVLRSNNQLMYAYNAMWRRLGEPDDHEDSIVPGYTATRARGTFARDKKRQYDWRTLDHVLVTKRVLLGGPIRLNEASLTVEPPYKGSSDHHALSVDFD